MTDEERFWSHVSDWNDSDSDTCWLWTAGTYGNGYGSCSVNGRSLRSHRYSYSLAFGTIPKGLVVCHHCDVPLCVRPSHLFLGTRKTNSDDRDAKNRTAHGDAHWNHKLTDAKVADITGRYAAGTTLAKLASIHGVSETTISRAVRGKQWKRAGVVATEKRNTARGESHARAKVTEYNVKQLRTLAASGVKIAVLSQQFGVTYSTVRKIVHRMLWSHVV